MGGLGNTREVFHFEKKSAKTMKFHKHYLVKPRSRTRNSGQNFLVNEEVYNFKLFNETKSRKLENEPE